MPRRLILALALITIAPTVFAQGIRGVTRRTTTLERQQPARQFFDAAGLRVQGTPNPAPNRATPSQTPVATAQPRPAQSRPAIAQRPPVTLPPISQRIARPQVALTQTPFGNPKPMPMPRPRPMPMRPPGNPSTPPAIATTLLPAKSHAKP